MVDTADGERVLLWHVPPSGDKPVILYFHGNGGALRHRVDRFRALTADGTGLVALSYRGYSGSTGRPTEAGLLEDAAAAYAFAAARYPPERIALWGELLGSGVAVALAAEKPVGRVVLEAGFSSAADVGAGVYWYVPVRLLMKDQFRSDLRIGKVTAPVLMLHGDRDNIIPIALGRAALCADQCAQALRALSRRRTREPRPLRGDRGGAAVSGGEITTPTRGGRRFAVSRRCTRRYLAARRPAARLAARRFAAGFFADRRHSSLLASRAPAASASSFAHMICGCTRAK